MKDPDPGPWFRHLTLILKYAKKSRRAVTFKNWNTFRTIMKLETDYSHRPEDCKLI